MTDDIKTDYKLCQTCGSKNPADAERCLVCGTTFDTNGDTKAARTTELRGSRMPMISMSLPLAIGLLAIFLGIGAGIVYFALRETDQIVVPTIMPTITTTTTATITPTPETPTPTATMEPSPTPFTYIVQPGDTCGDIAIAFDVSITSIVRLNSLPANCDTLFEGQELSIPNPTPTASPFPTATLSGLDATLAACESVVYTVQEGDTLSSIATNYAVPMSAIQEFNAMVNTTVFQGLDLTIPLCARAATPGPSPTPTPPPPYSAPDLLRPSDGAAFSVGDDVITLQWASVGVLNENEAYEITIEDITEGEGRRIVSYVRDTSFVVPASFRAASGTPHIYKWTVTTVRQVDTDEDGEPVWESGGAISDPRVFTWVSSGTQPTSTP